VVKPSLEAEAVVNVKEIGDGRTALYIAAEVGHEMVVKLLLEAEADVNVKEIKDGATALHVVAQGEHEAVVKKLLDSDLSYRGEACQHLDLDLVSLQVKGHFGIRKVLQYSLQKQQHQPRLQRLSQRRRLAVREELGDRRKSQ
jgi:ankyrin repeat protein